MKIKILFINLSIIFIVLFLSGCNNNDAASDETLYDIPKLQGTYVLEYEKEAGIISYRFCINTYDPENNDSSYEYTNEDKESPFVFIYDPENQINEYGTCQLIDDSKFTFTTDHFDNGMGEYKDGILTITYGDENLELIKESSILYLNEIQE